MTHAVIGWKSVLFESMEPRAELKLSRQNLLVLIYSKLNSKLCNYLY